MTDPAATPDGSWPDAFSHGYVLTNAPEPDHCRGWRAERLGGLTLFLHHKTAAAVSTSRHSGHTVVLVGQPVDVDSESISGDGIAAACLEILDHEGAEAAVRYVAYLGGRFVAFLLVDGTLTVVPDCHATQSAFWAVEDGSVCVASHTALVADALGLGPDEQARALLAQLKRLKPQGTRYYPGVRTGFQNVRPVTANCLLSVSLGSGQATHLRFYPFKEIPAARTVEEAFATFEQYLLTHVRLLTGFGQTGISLTSGGDSLATLRAALAGGAQDMFAFTYFLAASPTPNNIADVMGANQLAFEAGIRHKVLRWAPGQRSVEFDALFNRTWPDGGQAKPVARCMYEELPRNFYELQSTVAETGTVFYPGRKTPEISPIRLASLWQGTTIGNMEEFHREFAEFIEYSQFTADDLLNIDYHDAFYWEHRNTCWAANRYHEGDLGHRVLLPFNHRGLIEAMLSIPVADRRKAVLIKMFADKYAQIATPVGCPADSNDLQEISA
ncbi:MAG: hypothetical protein JWQ75_226 [Pseudarthrobacter sp.]|nr:hypothetical protein [Pseudarthrobacter sp.]